MYLFKEYVEYRLTEEEIPPTPDGFTEVEKSLWLNDRWRKFWIIQHPEYLKNLKAAPQSPVMQQQPIAKTLTTTQAASQQLMQRELSRIQPLENKIQDGFSTGGAVSDNLIMVLRLRDINKSLVAESEGTSGQTAYPFFYNKRAGQYVLGRDGKPMIMYKKDYPIHVFRDKFVELLKQRYNAA
jgi:hypothetical protein